MIPIINDSSQGDMNILNLKSSGEKGKTPKVSVVISNSSSQEEKKVSKMRKAKYLNSPPILSPREERRSTHKSTLSLPEENKNPFTFSKFFNAAFKPPTSPRSKKETKEPVTNQTSALTTPDISEDSPAEKRRERVLSAPNIQTYSTNEKKEGNTIQNIEKLLNCVHPTKEQQQNLISLLILSAAYEELFALCRYTTEHIEFLFDYLSDQPLHVLINTYINSKADKKINIAGTTSDSVIKAYAVRNIILVKKLLVGISEEVALLLWNNVFYEAFRKDEIKQSILNLFREV